MRANKQLESNYIKKTQEWSCVFFSMFKCFITSYTRTPFTCMTLLYLHNLHYFKSSWSIADQTVYLHCQRIYCAPTNPDDQNIFGTTHDRAETVSKSTKNRMFNRFTSSVPFASRIQDGRVCARTVAKQTKVKVIEATSEPKELLLPLGVSWVVGMTFCSRKPPRIELSSQQ